MGNAQSVEPPRRQSHKLSKPKTGNHASDSMFSPRGFSKSASRYSNNPLPNPPPPSPSLVPVTSPTTLSSTYEIPNALDYEHREHRIDRTSSLIATASPQKEKRRRSLFRSRSSQGDRNPESRSRSIASTQRVADMVNRTSSLTYESAVAYYGQPTSDAWTGQPGSRASWNYNLTSYEAKRLLNLTEEGGLERAPTISENRTTVVTESTWKSSNPSNTPAIAAISRANSDVSLYMPVRRRSVLQTPGVATRANSVHESPALPSRANFRYSHPASPNLSRQQSFESYRSGVVSMPPRIQDWDSDLVPRVSTPCEDEYQSIGAFKLGSLRITNGAASPSSPEAKKHHRDAAAARLVAHEEDGHGNERSNGTPISSVRPVPKSPELLPKIEAPQPRMPHRGPIAASFLDAGVIGDNVDSDHPAASNGPDATVVKTSPQYLDEIQFSPFSLNDAPLLSPVSSPKLQTTSKLSALEDSLFDDEAQLEYSSVEVLDVRLDHNAKSQSGQSETDAGSCTRVSRTDSGLDSTTSPSLDYPHKSLTKADSGYSSNVSLRSFRSKNQSTETESLDKQLSRSSQGSVSVRSEETALSSQNTSYLIAPLREPLPPPVPPKDYPPSPLNGLGSAATPAKQLPRSLATSDSRAFVSSGMSRTSRHSPAPLVGLVGTGRGPASPSSMPRTPASAKSAVSDASSSALSIGSISNKPSRLQRLLSGVRTSSAGPLTVHATHNIDQTSIPSIPREVENKLHEHAGLFPMATKRLALQHNSSKDTLKTIFSVGSMEASLDAVASIPVVAVAPKSEDSEGSETKDAAWKQTLQSVPASIAHVATQMIPRKSIARKPAPVAEDSAATTESEVVKLPATSTFSHTSSQVRSGAEAGTQLGRSSASGAERTAIRSPKPTPAPRPINLTILADRDTAMRTQKGSPVLPTSPRNFPSPPLPSPLAKARAVEKTASAPPPVSLTSRQYMPLRVPPPLRSQSSASSLNRKVSQESIRGYSAHQAMGEGLQRSVSASPAPSMDPRRLSSFRPRGPQIPNRSNDPWDVQTEHHILRRTSQNSLNGDFRRYSLTSAQQYLANRVQRPSSAQGWKVTGSQLPLRHRSSYDGYSYPPQPFQRGYAPSMSNGYTAPTMPDGYTPSPAPVYDPRAGSYFDAATGQWVSDQRYPPYVPRGHHQRNRSMSNGAIYPSNPPYRILHSYNSPAYRNAPIWG